MAQALERIVVVGTSCCGKSAFSRKLAQALGCARVELDELFWGPDWTPKPYGFFTVLFRAVLLRFRYPEPAATRQLV